MCREDQGSVVPEEAASSSGAASSELVLLWWRRASAYCWFKGQMVDDGDGPVEGFQVHLGGSLAYSGFGRKMRQHKVVSGELADYIERVVRNFVKQREGGERFAQWAVRADEADLTKPPISDCARAEDEVTVEVSGLTETELRELAERGASELANAGAEDLLH